MGKEQATEKAPSSGRKTAGTILLCMAAFVMLVCTMIDGAEGFLAGILCASPFILCGIICFTVVRHTGLWCAWTVYVCVDTYLRVATGISWKTILWSFYYAADMKYTINLLVGCYSSGKEQKEITRNRNKIPYFDYQKTAVVLRYQNR